MSREEYDEYKGKNVEMLIRMSDSRSASTSRDFFERSDITSIDRPIEVRGKVASLGAECLHLADVTVAEVIASMPIIVKEGWFLMTLLDLFGGMILAACWL